LRAFLIPRDADQLFAPHASQYPFSGEEEDQTALSSRQFISTFEAMDAGKLRNSCLEISEIRFLDPMGLIPAE
jgi:hypothetical protein